MTLKLDNLDVRFESPRLTFINPENAAFLRGERSELISKHRSPSWKIIGTLLLIGGVLMVIGAIAITVATLSSGEFDALASALIFGCAAIAIFGGLYMRSEHQRETDLLANATHVVEGVITSAIHIKKQLICDYRFKSPTTDKDLRGTINVSRLSPEAKRLVLDAHVAVLYKDDKNHMPL